MAVFFVLGGCKPADPTQAPSEPPPAETEYANPVYAPIFADPAVIRHERVYYAYGTEDNGIWSATESGVRYIPIIKSVDLVRWEYAGQVFSSYSAKPSWGTTSANLWAPDVVKIGDKFMLYYSLSKWGDPNPGIGIAVADHPLGPWEDRGELLRSSTIEVNNSIDPTVFKGADGNMYMIWGSFRGLYGARLTADGTAFYAGSQAAAAGTKTLIAAGGTVAATYEGAYIMQKDGWYYMFVSNGSCCDGFTSTYNVRVSRSRQPLGPYSDNLGRNMTALDVGTLVVQGGKRFVGTGHNAVTTDDAGNYYMLYHGYDKHELAQINGTNRRALLIDKLLWTDDGWPYVSGYTPAEEAPMPVINK